MTDIRGGALSRFPDGLSARLLVQKYGAESFPDNFRDGSKPNIRRIINGRGCLRRPVIRSRATIVTWPVEMDLSELKPKWPRQQ